MDALLWSPSGGYEGEEWNVAVPSLTELSTVTM
jgi:hypothetical protein